MSHENAMVGLRIRPGGLKMRRQHRSLDERLFVRFPALYRSFAACWSRLPKHSRLGRLILIRVVAQATSAANRRDFDEAFEDLTRIFQVFTFHRGLVAKQEDFGERAEALEAAGFRE